MRKPALDAFLGNILFVFAGSTLANILNLLCQLFIAHALPTREFSLCNSLLAVFVIASAPLAVLQLAAAKFSAEYNGRGDHARAARFIAGFLTHIAAGAGITLAVFLPAAASLARFLHLPSASYGFMLVFLVASAWLLPACAGALQGLELFKWSSAATSAGGIIKLLLVAAFVLRGYGVFGVLAAMVLANLCVIALFLIPLRAYLKTPPAPEHIRRLSFKPAAAYFFPLALAQFSFMSLVSYDMIAATRVFSRDAAGSYALAQMAGKIFLFLPGAVSIVMFPRVSSMNACAQDTRCILTRSLLYTLGLCAAAACVYNLFPVIVMKALTGKVDYLALTIGRLCAFSMSCWALVNILTAYFLSLRDLRFLWFLCAGALVQAGCFHIFRSSVLHIQYVMCAVSVIMLVIHLILAYNKRRTGRIITVTSVYSK